MRAFAACMGFLLSCKSAMSVFFFFLHLDIAFEKWGCQSDCLIPFTLCAQDDSYIESYISTIGVDFVSFQYYYLQIIRL